MTLPPSTLTAAPSPAPTAWSRRRFLQAAAVTAGSGVLAAGAAAQPPEPKTGWIDAHVHVWTPDTERYRLAPGFQTADMQPPSFTDEELLAHCQPEGVDRVVLIQMVFYGIDNRYMLDVIAARPQTFVGVGIVDPYADGVAQTLKDLVRQGVRGLRIHPADNEAQGWIRDEAMLNLWRTAREQGVAICPLINPVDLPHVDAMCAKLPGLTVVVDHFARIGLDGNVTAAQLEALCKLARYPDVYVKTSAFYALGQRRAPHLDLAPLIRRVVDAFGPQRLMWGSDCPYQVQEGHTYRDSIALIRDRLDFLSAGDREAILKGTAESVFFAAR